MTAAPSVNAPTVLHVVRYRFAPNSHPATWRTILGLRRHFRNVVVSGTRPGYFPQSAADEARLASEAGIEVLAEQDIDGLPRPEVAARMSASVRRYGRIDAVVGHLLGGPRAFYLARELSAPILTFFHGDDANIHLEGEEFGAAYAGLRASPTAFFLGVAQNLVNRLLAFGMPPERTFLHHLGLDVSGYPSPPRRDSRRPLKIVMIGLFRRQKGHALAIHAFARFIRHCPDASLHFIGGAVRPEHRRVGEELKSMVERMDLEHAIHFRGCMPLESVAQELAGADVVLQTSLFVAGEGPVEGIPNAILEAMASGVPVVATRHGGIPEAVAHDRTGLLIDEGDVEGLANALSRLAADPGLRRRYGLEGRRVVEERFNERRQSDLMAERLSRMMQQAHR